MSGCRRIVVILSMVFSVALLSACAKPPQAEIDQAQAGMTAAATAEASTYAAEAWDVAQQSMNAATAEIEAQKAKFGLTRSFKQAKALLATAQQDAAAAEQAAVVGKELARTEVEQAVVAIEAGFAQADQLLQTLSNCKRRPKGFSGDLELLRGNVDGLRGQLAEVQTAAAEEQYIEAKTLAQELLGLVEAVVADLENARVKIGC